MGKVEIEVVNYNLTVVHGAVVNYDQPPSTAMEGLPYNDPDVASYPQPLWNGGKSGIVEGVDIPIYIPSRYFTTAEGRKAQAEIGYGCPADVAALKGEDIRKLLRAEGLYLWALVALRQSNEQLWQFNGDCRPALLLLAESYLGFNLGDANDNWGDYFGLVGVPKVPEQALGN